MDEEYRDKLQGELDEIEDQYEDQRDLQESQQESYDATYPATKADPSVYNLFWKVLRLDDSTKVANLTRKEIGDLNISVRDAQKLGMLGHVFHHQTFGNFFIALSEITNKTSMSKDGWFSELFVSQKKFSQRSRRSSSLNKDKWKLFGKPTTQDQGAQEQQGQ